MLCEKGRSSIVQKNWNYFGVLQPANRRRIIKFCYVARTSVLSKKYNYERVIKVFYCLFRTPNVIDNWSLAAVGVPGNNKFPWNARKCHMVIRNLFALHSSFPFQASLFLYDVLVNQKWNKRRLGNLQMFLQRIAKLIKTKRIVVNDDIFLVPNNPE
jgi:hypothetical protein